MNPRLKRVWLSPDQLPSPLPHSLPPSIGLVYPRLADIRTISAKIAVEVMKSAAEDGILRGKAAERLGHSEAKLAAWVKVCVDLGGASPLQEQEVHRGW